MIDRSKKFLLSLGLPDDPTELLTPAEHDALNQHLEAMAQQRRQVEATTRDLPMCAPAPPQRKGE